MGMINRDCKAKEERRKGQTERDRQGETDRAGHRETVVRIVKEISEENEKHRRKITGKDGSSERKGEIEIDEKYLQKDRGLMRERERERGGGGGRQTGRGSEIEMAPCFTV